MRRKAPMKCRCTETGRCHSRFTEQGEGLFVLPTAANEYVICQRYLSALCLTCPIAYSGGQRSRHFLLALSCPVNSFCRSTWIGIYHFKTFQFLEIIISSNFPKCFREKLFWDCHLNSSFGMADIQTFTYVHIFIYTYRHLAHRYICVCWRQISVNLFDWDRLKIRRIHL